MNGDWFTARHLVSEEKLSDDQRGILVDVAASMLRSGLSASDWCALSDESRGIFEDAGRLVWLERAAVLVTLMSDPVAAAAVLGGEEAAIAAALDKKP
jgi:hypothetical protein